MHGEGVPFNLYMRDKKIEKADLTGLKLRVTPIYRAFFRALGSQIVVIPPPEVLSALERGTVDGYGWPVWDIKTTGWDKYTKYMIEPGFYTVAGNIFINLPKWNSLSPQAKQILAKAGEDYDTKEWKTRVPAKEAKYKKERDDAGVQIVKLPAAESAKYVKTAYDAGWAELEGLDAANAKILKPLFTK
jgi:TRAP-type transport system periplasmic protein